MPTNKNALIRYKVLDRCFSDFRRRYEIDDLIDEVNETLYDLYGTSVSLRQIREDIKYMRDRVTYDAPIVAYNYAGKRCYYRYSDPDYSIFNNELSSEELDNLRSTIDMLGRFRGGNNSWLEEVVSRLEYRFGVKGKSKEVVSFEQNDQLTGLEYLGELIDYAINCQPISLTYRTYRGKERTNIIHPYYLKQYNNRWFLFGLEETQRGNRLTNKALDRIVKYSVANVSFITNEDIDFETFFRDVVGVTIPEEHPQPEDIILKFEPERFPYVVSKPIHHSQKILSSDDCTLQITVRVNKELESQIFSYLPHVEILSPQWFRLQIQQKLTANLNKYLNPS